MTIFCNRLLNHPLVLPLLLPSVGVVGNRIASGSWWPTSWSDWAIAITIVIVCSALLLIVFRFRALKKQQHPNVLFGRNPLLPDIRLGDLVYKNAKWRISVAHPILPFRSPHEHCVEVKTPPRCEKCDVELDETETFFGSYKWLCVSCGNEIKSAKSFEAESSTVQKLAQSQWENNPEMLKVARHNLNARML